ncbi:hypothetical protein [Alishewanella tabrizica]|uniref:Uncharacterized protein n=1 Tax=Alishewanella tabrizica TaxID=671278 RepID=A0ABQ2WDN3_9ALTE|nr:hypothetical protein [Alishewanella tabrizica]GGW50158.1 hypothetical protein GCM10008111_02510 [Alishewanella tabrizica]
MSINASNTITPSNLLTPATNRPQPARAVVPEKESTVNQAAGIRIDRDVIQRLDTEREAQQTQQFARESSRASSRNTAEQNNERAIAAYQSLQNEQRRSEVQAMLGVDLYA